MSNLSSTGAVTQLFSDNGAYQLTLQPGGNLVETNYQKAVWQSYTDGRGASTATIQNDGNFVIYQTSTGAPTYNSQTYNVGVPPYAMTLQNDGNLVIYDSRNVEIWSNHVGDSSLDVPLVSPKGTVTSSGALTTQLKSPNLVYSLTMQQGDGNLVLYKQGQAIWHTATYNKGVGPYRATMQNDGNFVIYDGHNSPLWSSSTSGQGVAPYQLALNNFGDVYVKDSLGHRLWSAVGTANTVNLTGAAWSPPVPSVIKNYYAQGKCFDAAAGYNGVQAHLWDCNGANYNQSLLYTLDQQLQIATDTSRCLTYETNTGVVDTQPCTGDTIQKWVFNAADGAYGTIQPLKSSGLCLDTYRVGTANNTPIQIYQCTGGDGQKWSKSPIGHGVFNPGLAWWPNSTYTDSSYQASQRAAWAQVSTNLTNAINSGSHSFTIPAGIYRTGGVPAYISNTSNFTLNAPGVEIIAENTDHAFYLANNSNFVLNGPMTFDQNTGSSSQGTINYTDASTYIGFSLAAGSPLPAPAGSRIMLYDKNGQMESQNIYQYNTVNGGGGQYSVSSFGRNTFGAQYGEFGGGNVDLGNYIATFGGNGATLMQSYHDTSVTINDVVLYSGNLFNSPSWNTTQTNFTLNRVTAPRRPGTSRLSGGGIGFFGQLTTGSINIFESEAAWSTDDVTDPFSETMFAASDVQSNVASNQIRATGWGCFTAGDTINVYDPITLQLVFSDRLYSCAESNGEYLLTFATHGPGTVKVNAIIDDATAQPTIIYADSYFHDAQSNGMQAQGGKYVSFTNNYVHNAAVSVTGFDTVWGPAGGGAPIDIVINNNTMNRQMLYQNPIVINLQTGNPTATPIHSATVLNNLMMTWQNSGPLVTQVQSTNISGNVITSSLPNF